MYSFYFMLLKPKFYFSNLMGALVSGYGEVNFEPHDISQTGTHKLIQPGQSELTSLKKLY